MSSKKNPKAVVVAAPVKAPRGARGKAIEACLSNAPKKCKAIEVESKAKAVRNHLEWLVERDLVVKSDDGYRWKDKASKKARAA